MVQKTAIIQLPASLLPCRPVPIARHHHEHHQQQRRPVRSVRNFAADEESPDTLLSETFSCMDRSFVS